MYSPSVPLPQLSTALAFADFSASYEWLDFVLLYSDDIRRADCFMTRSLIGHIEAATAGSLEASMETSESTTVRFVVAALRLLRGVALTGSDRVASPAALLLSAARSGSGSGARLFTRRDVQHRLDEHGVTRLASSLVSSSHSEIAMEALALVVSLTLGGNQVVQVSLLQQLSVDHSLLRSLRLVLSGVHRTLTDVDPLPSATTTPESGVQSRRSVAIPSATAGRRMSRQRLAAQGMSMSAREGSEMSLHTHSGALLRVPSAVEVLERGDEALPSGGAVAAGSPGHGVDALEGNTTLSTYKDTPILFARLALRAIQLFAEGHFAPMQDFLRSQEGRGGESEPMVLEAVHLFFALMQRISAPTLRLLIQAWT